MLELSDVAVCPLAASGSRLVSTEKLDPRKADPGDDGQTLWYDCKDLAIEGKGWTDTLSYYDRLPARAHGRVPEDVWTFSRCSAGLCVYFAADAPSVQVRWTLRNEMLAMLHMPATAVSGVDLYRRNEAGQWRFWGNGRPDAPVNAVTFSPPAGSECLLYLPLYNGVKSVVIGIPKYRTLRTPATEAIRRRKSIVFYGTSIVQGGCASRPGMAAAAVVGRALDVHVINLGFNGCGRIEPEVADLMAELDPSVFVVDCLWNVQPELVATRAAPFVGRLRASRPSTPILLAEDSSFQSVSPTPRGRVLRGIFETLVAAGDTNLHFLSNQDMLGSDGEGTVDGCHPNDLGMLRQAAVFSKALLPLLTDTLNR
jgi:hypothetical protein